MLNSLDSLEGTASVVFSYGKKKIGYELKGKLTFDKGELVIDNIDEYGDFEFGFNQKSSGDWEDFQDTFKEAIKAFVDKHFS